MCLIYSQYLALKVHPLLFSGLKFQKISVDFSSFCGSLGRFEGREPTGNNSVTGWAWWAWCSKCICWAKRYQPQDTNEMSPKFVHFLLTLQNGSEELIGHTHGSLDWDSTSYSQHQCSITFACYLLAPHFFIVILHFYWWLMQRNAPNFK